MVIDLVVVLTTLNVVVPNRDAINYTQRMNYLTVKLTFFFTIIFVQINTFM